MTLPSLNGPNMVSPVQVETLARALADGRVLGIGVVECRPSWRVRALLLGLPPLLFALGLIFLMKGPLPLGPLGWGLTWAGLGLRVVAFFGPTMDEPTYELRAKSRGMDFPVLRYTSWEAVENARCAVLKAALGGRRARRKRRR